MLMLPIPTLMRLTSIPLNSADDSNYSDAMMLLIGDALTFWLILLPP